MNRYIIGSLWDRNNRNGINKNFEYLFEGRQKIDELNFRADKILRDAEVVIRNNTNTNERLNRIIADSGTSSTEVIDARGNHEVLSARLNDYDYLVSRPMLNNGKIILPSVFPEVPFNIYRKDKYDYTHDATPYNQFDWSDATEVFISEVGSAANTGELYSMPTSFTGFELKLKSGAYGSTKTFILTLLDNVYSSAPAVEYGSLAENILIRSKSPRGKTLLGRAKKIGRDLSSWTQSDGVYKASLIDGTTHPIGEIINTIKLDSFGFYAPYIKKNSLSAVNSTPGTYYQNGADIHVNPRKSDNINELLLMTTGNYLSPSNNHKVVIFENIHFATSSTSFYYENGINALYFFGCGFYRGWGNDAFSMNGDKYNVYLFDCVSAYGAKDGYNYHTSSKDSLAVEINCHSFGNGLHKRDFGNATTHSNNGSTAHDGMNMLRVGSHYWDNEGPVVADVNDCYSISIGVKVGDIIPTTTGSKSAFYYSDEYATGLKPKFVIECESYGSNIVNGIQAPSGNTYYMDFIGHDVINGAEQISEWGS